MKRYSLFYGAYYYPGKGMQDFKATSDNPHELIRLIEREQEGIWSHIYDNQEQQFVLISHDLDKWEIDQDYPHLIPVYTPSISDKVYLLESLFLKKGD